jgi:glycosyltransferase involved in cell wall biosynthesis
MASSLSISIIVCTRNRGAALEQSLATLGKVRIPDGWKIEIILVDNASTDNTAAVAQKIRLEKMEVRYFFEPRKGKSNALNTGLAQVTGEIILFIDDDVFVAEDWLEQIVHPLLREGCDAVVGKVTLAPELVRPWMTERHKWWLAQIHDAQLVESTRELIGANMGLRRSVLQHVPAFDPELGPGAMGFGEDTLFGWQMMEAGLKIDYVQEAVVVHKFDASRLRRLHWLDDARKHGQTDAYIDYHWKHVEVTNPRLTSLWYGIKLKVKRIFSRLPKLEEEGCPRWEMGFVWRMEFCRRFCCDRQQPRKYTKRGLKKL